MMDKGDIALFDSLHDAVVSGIHAEFEVREGD